MHPVIEKVTQEISRRSADSRSAYLSKIERAIATGPLRTSLSCSNLAHGIAACGQTAKDRLGDEVTPNLAIVTAYNDMLSAHQPYENYPEQIRNSAAEAGAVAQVAGGVPAMCDGVTQGEAGMDLSLFSRDVIALSTAVALSHNMFDGVLCLGICDKIVPGQLIGTLAFGHLPAVFVPAGPMSSGLPNKEKAAVREAFAAGEAGRTELIAAESASYHSPGTCTFYGTANSNQMLMEFMGLQLPGGSFVNPDSEIRKYLTQSAVLRLLEITHLGNDPIPLGHIIDEKVIVNAIVGLLATGGSTNHTIHLVAIAAAAGILINWSDFAELSKAIPLLARVYPNGMADVNHFHEAGGLGFVMAELLDAGLLHEDVNTIMGRGLNHYTSAPVLEKEKVTWHPISRVSGDHDILRKIDNPFSAEGGMSLVQGSLGRAMVKVSAVDPDQRKIIAPARVFRSQEAFAEAFEAGDLDDDMVVVLTHQGPTANGMPELHKLTPCLGVMQNKGHKVALLTDGRMSGASGKVLAAIQLTPEAAVGGLLGRIEDGDMITIDTDMDNLEVAVNLAEREIPEVDLSHSQIGMGRELFGVFRQSVVGAEQGASIFSGK